MMSLNLAATLICDGCGALYGTAKENRFTRMKEAVWELRRLAERDNWTIVNRGPYHTNTHWCSKCSSKPMKPVPRKKATISIEANHTSSDAT